MGIDKKQGYFILAVGFLVTIMNQFLKLIFRIPRPGFRIRNLPLLKVPEQKLPVTPFPAATRKTALEFLAVLHGLTKTKL